MLIFFSGLHPIIGNQLMLKTGLFYRRLYSSFGNQCMQNGILLYRHEYDYWKSVDINSLSALLQNQTFPVCVVNISSFYLRGSIYFAETIPTFGL